MKEVVKTQAYVEKTQLKWETELFLYLLINNSCLPIFIYNILLYIYYNITFNIIISINLTKIHHIFLTKSILFFAPPSSAVV